LQLPELAGPPWLIVTFFAGTVTEVLPSWPSMLAPPPKRVTACTVNV